jgi:histidinol-phosphate/aromatic aminotransferase/cobyric acid decarboxylase-like protein
MGPVRAATYLLVYGLLSLAMGACWAVRLPWRVSVPACAVARVAGYAAYVALSSWAANENLLALMVENMHSLLVRAAVGKHVHACWVHARARGARAAALASAPLRRRRRLSKPPHQRVPHN